MLQILYGTDWRENADRLLDRLCARAAAGEDRQILIVPEQFSFDAEWRLCARGGDSIARYAEVLSFTRLYDRVCAVTGGAAAQIMDRSGRLIAMAGALEQVRSRLKLYGAHAAKPEFLLSLLALYEEFQSYGVKDELLQDVQQNLQGRLAEKLEELGLIFESYESICANAAQDPATRLTKLADKLIESDFAENRSVWIDGFTDFTAQELDVIGALLRSGARVTVALCCDGLRSGQELFSVTRQTARQLLQLEGGAETTYIEKADRPAAAAFLAERLFAAQTAVFEQAAPIGFTECADPYQQALRAAAGIQQLVRRGVRWKQIAVACTDLQQLQPALASIFARLGIPGYFAGTRELLQTPVVRMLLSALRAAGGRMAAEDVLDYLKSGAAPIDRADCDLLENYAVVWDLRGSQWEKPFENDPLGFGQNRKPEDYADILARLNAARQAAILPLLRLRRALSEARNTAGQILALNRFFDEIDLSGRLGEQTAQLQQAGDFRRAQQTAQIYDSLINTMEQIYGVLGGSVRTPEEFYQFFRAALSQCSVGTIPATLDCVHVGSLRDLRNNRAPYLFVLGASDGLLPARAAQTGLLSAMERKRLKSAGLSVAPDEGEQLARELLAAYTVLTSWDRELQLTCQAGEPSYLYTRLKKLFPNSGTLPAAPLPATEYQAAAALAAGEALPDDPALQAAAAALADRAGFVPGGLSPEAVRGLYGKTLYLSASRVDKFASCRLAYFLRYGLKAMERKQARVDAPLYGTFVHYVLEHTAKQVMQEGGFRTVTPQRLHEIAASAIEAFANEQLGGLSDQGERVQYLFRRSFDEVTAVVEDLWQELKDSEFIPVEFELPFERQNAVHIHGKTASADMSGFVDRVDRFDAPDGRSYVRVVDYKTGSKDFDYTDVLNGIGLQMLIYLFALEQRGTALLGTKVEGAGVLYFPAKVDVLSNVTRLSPEEAEKKRRDAFRRKGLVLDDERIRQAMEPAQTPVYLPCKTDRSGKRAYSADRAQLKALERFVYDKLAEMTDEIFAGDVTPNPYRRGEHSPCNYCEYAAVCHKAGGQIAERNLRQTGEERFWQEVERRNAEHG